MQIQIILQYLKSELSKYDYTILLLNKKSNPKLQIAFLLYYFILTFYFNYKTDYVFKNHFDDCLCCYQQDLQAKTNQN
jgi:hypothetical protein